MQDNPKAKDILDAIADFLMKDVIPSLEGNDGLSYKALVSWNMLGILSREWGKEESIIREEVYQLKEILHDTIEFHGKESLSELKGYIHESNKKLSKFIQEQEISYSNQKIWEFEKNRIKNRLSISNPRFSKDT